MFPQCLENKKNIKREKSGCFLACFKILKAFPVMCPQASLCTERWNESKPEPCSVLIMGSGVTFEMVERTEGRCQFYLLALGSICLMD